MPGPLWLQSIRRRPAAFVGILLLAAGAASVSTITPMLVSAVSAVSLRDDVAEASFPADGVAVSAVATPDYDVATAERAVADALRRAARTSDRWGEAHRVAEVQIVPRLFGPGRSPFAVRLSLAPSRCAGLRVTGRCPTGVFEGLLPRSLMRSTGWSVGTRVAERTVNPAGSLAFQSIGVLTVVGIYDDRSGDGPFFADPTRLIADAAPRATPNLVVGRRGYDTLNAPVQVLGGVRVARPVAQSDVPLLRRAVVLANRATLTTDAAASNAHVTSRLPALLDGVAARQSAAAVLGAPIGVGAVLLAWFALAAVAQRTARSRAAEWGVGRMRGARVRSWLASVFVEPLVAILLGVVLGYAAGLLLARLVAGALLGTAGDVDPFAAPVLAGVALAAGGSLAALVAASVRGALLPLPQLLQDQSEPRQASRTALVVQVAVVAVTLTALWTALTTETFTGLQLGLLLPATAALVAGLVAVRVAVAVVRRSSRRAPRSLVGLVVGRGLARAPSALVAAQLVLMSAALAACALQLTLLSDTAQTDRADLAVGAARVLSVQVPAGTSLLDTVRRADPTGRYALAAEQVVGNGAEPGGQVLAVDTTRVAAVSNWRDEWRRGVDLGRLAGGGTDLRLVGERLDLTVSGAEQRATDESGSTSVVLLVTVQSPDGRTTVGLGRLRDGVASGAVPCADGCRLISLSLHDATRYQQAWTAQATITRMATDRQDAAQLAPWLRGDRWRDRVVDEADPARPARMSPRSDPDGLAVRATATDAGDPQLEPAVGPAIVPAVVGADAELVRFPGIASAALGTSLANTPVIVRPVAEVPAVPRALRVGVLVDLATMQRAADPSLDGAEHQVWLAAGAPPSILTAIRRAGIRITDDERAATAVTAGLDSETNRAVRVGAATAGIGVAFGLLALAATRLVDMSERRRVWTALGLAGVSRRRQRSLALTQAAAPALIAVVVGVLVGAATASLIGTRLPLVVGGAAGPPLDPAVPIGPLAVLAGAFAVLVVVTAVVLTAIEVRDAR